MPKPTQSRLLTEERRRKILDILARDGRITVPQIVEEFQVSAVTARTDLDRLAERRQLSRSHGGAVQVLDPAKDHPLLVKRSVNHSEKVRIARTAVQLLKPHDTVILDSGSTTAEIAKELATLQVPITVITNALNIAHMLSHLPNMSLIMLGGLLRPTSSSFVGPHAEHVLRQFRADHLFLGVDGLDADAGASTPDILEAQLNALMMTVARSVTVVADSTKLGRRSLSVIGRLDQIHRVITTPRADPATVEALRQRGIEVVFA